MKIPLEWLKEYVDLNKEPKEIAESFTYLGLMLDKPISYYENQNYQSAVLDLEHRMDRADWLSIIGCARDLAAFEKTELKMPPSHKKPGKEPEKEQKIKIEVKCPELVRRFKTKVFRNIKVGPSPDWLKNRLEAYGIPSINNIVDITNYVMVEYGQPMHAQDINKLKAPEIVIRRAKKGEKVTTLLGETIELTDQQFVLTQAGEATVIGGIVGGNTTGVDQTTTDIVLDAGNYDQNNIRRSSRQLKIINETVLRYDKFLDPRLAEHAMERAVYLILELAGGEYYENTDWYPDPRTPRQMTLTGDRLKKISGEEFPLEKAEKILNDLSYKTINKTPGSLEMQLPYFRTDVEVEDDLIADVLRIYNYNKLSLNLLDKAPPKEITPEIYQFEEKLRDHLVSIGLHEHITDPLVPKNEKNEKQLVLENALTVEKSALRTSIDQTLKKVVKLYEKVGIEQIRLFEIGKIYQKDGPEGVYDSYQEIRKLSVLNITQGIGVLENSKLTKKILASLMTNLGLYDYRMVQEKGKVNIVYQNDVLGNLSTVGFKLFTKKLLKYHQQTRRVRSEWQTLSTENLSLIIDIKQNFGPIYHAMHDFDPHIVKIEVLEEYTGAEIGKNKKTILVKVYYDTSEKSEIRKNLLEHLNSKYKVEHRD
jgi:phenylalanyl-tRNA synthetase beta subunit